MILRTIAPLFASVLASGAGQAQGTILRDAVSRRIAACSAAAAPVASLSCPQIKG